LPISNFIIFRTDSSNIVNHPSFFVSFLPQSSIIRLFKEAISQIMICSMYSIVSLNPLMESKLSSVI